MKSGIVVIVSPQIPIAYRNGGIGTFVYHFSKLLVGDGRKVEIVFTGTPEVPERMWRPFFSAMGITVHVVNPSSDEIPVGYTPLQYVSRRAHEVVSSIANVEAVYYADWRGNAVVPIRVKRTNTRVAPPIVTVLHGNSAWHRENMGWFPSSVDEMLIDASERYAIEHSDHVISPSAYGVRWAKRHGWRTVEEPHVLHYPFVPDDLMLASDKGAFAAGRPCRELVFFGRLETRKGVELFVDALTLLANGGGMGTVEKILLLGQEGSNRIGSAADIAAAIKKATGLPSEIQTNLGMHEAIELLRARADRAVVAIPSSAETLGFVAIETSLIGGMNVICANSTALPEVFGGSGDKQLFEPTAKGLAAKLRSLLDDGLMGPEDLVGYDFARANQRWLAFHDEIVSRHAVSVSTRERAVPVATDNLVDVCIPSHNLGRYLTIALEGLAAQTDQRFNLFVLDDGSADEGEATLFEAIAKKYDRKNWHFARQENTGVCVARNRLAAMGSAKYILWMDADNVPSPNMIERFVEAIELTGDDVLTCYSYQFAGEGSPYVGEDTTVLRPAVMHYIPFGNFPTLSLVNYNPFGDLHSIMRRDAFVRAGGFDESYPKHVNHEDQQLFVHMSLLGMSFDVVPEYLYFYRIREDSRLRTTPKFLNESRVLDGYLPHLQKLGMGDAAPFVAGLLHAVNALHIGSEPMSGQTAPMSSMGPKLLSSQIRMKDLLHAIVIKIVRRLRARRPFKL